MAASLIQLAKRALVSVLLALAQQYGVRLQISRESADGHVESAFRSLVKKVHPDKGGNVGEMQRLQKAMEEWRSAKAKSARVGGRPARTAVALLGDGEKKKRSCKILSSAVLLTYHGVEVDVWQAFVCFVKDHLLEWGVVKWCASMERCESGKPHTHLMVQFFAARQDREVDAFSFHGARPNASSTDVCGEGLCRKQLQRSIDRGMFYVFADKIGTVFDDDGLPFTTGNYLPCWVSCEKTYQVIGKWPETLWKQRKISSVTYERLLFLSRDGVVSRKRNLEACLEHEEAHALRLEVDQRSARIRSNPQLYRPFAKVPQAEEWLQMFEVDALRYPIMVVLGPSRAGKTEWAKSLFQNPLELKIGTLEFFPDAMRSFKRGVHDGLVLDDVRDLQFLVNHQEKLQGKYDCLVEFGSTAGGTCAYHRDLFGVPVVATVNFSTKRLEYLESHDWLANPGNRVLVNL
ncbi:Uncharacterized protein SCF082_LOCUS33419 [Durusdinium trenchii]|uniref:Replication-associated protein n=1 Tax=Durusdinium trenchii TaxID=1381693 RepID=A0ABP0NNZ4_9DINO